MKENSVHEASMHIGDHIDSSETRGNEMKELGVSAGAIPTPEVKKAAGGRSSQLEIAPSDTISDSRPPRVLFVSRSLAVSDYHGGSVYADAVLRFLGEQGCEISYLWLAQPVDASRPVMRVPAMPAYLHRFGVSHAARFGPLLVAPSWRHWSRIPAFVLSKIAKQASSRPSLSGEQPDWRVSDKERRALEKAIRVQKPDAVIIDGTEIADVLPDQPRDSRGAPRTLLLTHNVLHQRAASYRTHNLPLDFPDLDHEAESRFLARADVLIAIQENDAATFRSMRPDREVIVAPMPAIPCPLPTEHHVPGRCIFVGGATQHNIDGLRWFLHEIWPEVLRQLPNASISVCGTVRESFPENYPQCTFHGNVSDLTPFYEKASAAIVPLRSGSGLKIKLVEAISYGRAVVSTSIGVQGLPELVAGHIVPVADDASLFAGHVVQVLRDENIRGQIIRGQRDWAHQHLQPDRSFAPLLQSICAKATQCTR